MVTFQWQSGRKVIVWPDDLAADKPLPTPPEQALIDGCG
jgi:hypothetical protein